MTTTFNDPTLGSDAERLGKLVLHYEAAMWSISTMSPEAASRYAAETAGQALRGSAVAVYPDPAAPACVTCHAEVHGAIPQAEPDDPPATPTPSQDHSAIGAGGGDDEGYTSAAVWAHQGLPRFFIEHDVIHDRVTGRHVRSTPREQMATAEDAIEECCALLNDLADKSMQAIERELQAAGVDVPGFLSKVRSRVAEVQETDSSCPTHVTDSPGAADYWRRKYEAMVDVRRETIEECIAKLRAKGNTFDDDAADTLEEWATLKGGDTR